MLVSFKGDEEKLIDSVISVLDAGREKFTFQEMNIISELQHKGIIINLERREVIRNGKKVGMTYTEFEILQLLAQNPGRVFSKEQIYDMVCPGFTSYVPGISILCFEPSAFSQ